MIRTIAIDLSFVDAQPTGIGHYAVGLATALHTSDSTYELLAWDGLTTRPLGSWLAGHAAGAAPRAQVRSGAAHLRRLPFAHTAARWIRARIAPRFPIFHAINYTPSFAVRGTVIPTLHDLSFLRRPDLLPPDRAARLAAAAGMIAQAPAVHVVSQFTAGEAVALLGIRPDRIFIIPPAVTPLEPATGPLPFDLRFGSFVLYVGARDRRKNLALLTAAYLALPTRQRAALPLVLAGPGSPGDLPEAAHHAIGRGEIRVTGYLPTAAIRQLMRSARVFVYPSLYEGFGMPVLEALSEGTPVIASRGVGLEEAACGLATLVDPNDLDHWREAIGDALDREDEVTGRRRRSETALRTYSWARSARATLVMYGAVERQRSVNTAATAA